MKDEQSLCSIGFMESPIWRKRITTDDFKTLLASYDNIFEEV